MVRVPLRAAVAIVPAFILGILVMLGGNVLLGVYTDNVAYPAYMETLDLSEGSIGNVPTPDTPLAESVADMESMDTFYIIGSVAWDRPLPINGKVYYEVEIKAEENGVRTYTTFLARINQDASERLETGGRRLPIGRWLPLEGPDPDGVLDRNYSLDIKDHYADMLGDFGLIMTEGEFHAQHRGFDILEFVSICTMMVLWLVFYIVFSKKGWF